MLRKAATLVIYVFIIGCVPQPSTSTPDRLATIVAETLSVIQVIPTQPESTPEVTNGPFMVTPTAEGITLSPNQIQEGSGIFVYTSAENVNFRIGPGKLFQVSRVLAKNTQLELLGYSANNRWVMVKNNEGIIGWVGSLFVDGGFDGAPPPTVVPADAITINGYVYNDSGPMTDIGVALVQGEQFDESFTDETRNFYIYVPTTLKGDWFLQEYAIGCKSNLMDANCKCLNNSCGSLFPTNVKITFPLTSDKTYISFGWE